MKFDFKPKEIKYGLNKTEFAPNGIKFTPNETEFAQKWNSTYIQ